MSVGFVSNFNDSGYVGTNVVYGWRGVNNVSVTSVSSSDIYTTTQQCGVYMFDGVQGSSPISYSVYCSTSNLDSYLRIPNVKDDAWLVYPGFGFVLFPSANWGGNSSYYYVNNTNRPQLFYNRGGGFSSSGGTEIAGASYSGYPANTTTSLRIYFRGSEITIAGLTPNQA
jgi:hypothetical protein